MNSAHIKSPPLYLKVSAVTRETDQVNAYCLEALDGSDLPEFSAGAHLGIVMPGKITRYYSICSSPHQRKHYIIAVQREDSGRGGSVLVHKHVRVGSILKVNLPKNLFALADEGKSLLLAGGIGITPMLSMAATLEKAGRPYHLVYCYRGVSSIPFRGHLERLAKSGRATLLDTSKDRANLAQILENQSTDTHVYFCGSERFNNGVREACVNWEPERVHWESFNPVSPAGGTTFVAEARRSKKTFDVLGDETLLAALRRNLIPVESVCENGTCGTCKVEYLEGDVEHLDSVLTPEERKTAMMACVSRAKTRVVLDI